MTRVGEVPTITDVRLAAERIAPFATRTPVLQSDELDTRFGARLLFKCEQLQHTGSFKYRGATNAVRSLADAEAVRGVAAHSSGNHGQALAMAARLRGIPCHVVMPEGSVQVKLDAVRAQGATVHMCAPTMEARIAALDTVVDETGARMVHPYTDPLVIAGQGTAAMELLAEHPDLDTIVTPVGGGGLIGGSAIAAHAHDPAIRVLGAEPEGARDAYDSLATGVRVTTQTPDTICDGLRATVGPVNFDLMRAHGIEILLVSDDEVRAAMALLRETLGIAVEPSSATVLALVARDPDRIRDHTVGLVLTGGNVAK